MNRVLRIRQRESLERVRPLILRAITTIRYPGTTPQAFFDEIAENIAGDLLGVFVGYNDEPQAVAIAYLPATQTMMGAQIAVAYSEDRALSRLIGEQVRAWLLRHGHDRFYCLSFDQANEAYRRVFRHVGEMRTAGMLYEVKI